MEQVFNVGDKVYFTFPWDDTKIEKGVVKQVRPNGYYLVDVFGENFCVVLGCYYMSLDYDSLYKSNKEWCEDSIKDIQKELNSEKEKLRKIKDNHKKHLMECSKDEVKNV